MISHNLLVICAYSFPVAFSMEQYLIRSLILVRRPVIEDTVSESDGKNQKQSLINSEGLHNIPALYMLLL